MYLPPNIDILKKLDLSEAQIGDIIVFCENCLWQVINTGVKPVCPNCRQPLYITTVNQELFDL